MKKKITLLLLLIVFSSGFINAERVKFYIKPIVNGANPDLISGLIPAVVTYFDDYMKKVYPCVEVMTDEDITQQIGLEKMRQLLGTTTEGFFENLSGALDIHYLVKLEIGLVFDTDFIVSISIIPWRTKFPIIIKSEHNKWSSTAGGACLNSCDKVVKESIDALKKIEICSFQGPIKVLIKSKRINKEVEDYSVYCNGSDGKYHKEISINNSETQEWNLNRAAYNSAAGRVNESTNGEVKYHLIETTTIDEENDCYECQSGRKGGRTYHEKTVSTMDVQGLSEESELYDFKMADARTEIKFLDDDTYIIYFKAASKKGPKKSRVEKSAQGTCDNISPENKSIESEGNIPLDFKIGPFKGNSLSKVLSEKGTLNETDEDTKEERTITYEFNLRRN